MEQLKIVLLLVVFSLVLQATSASHFRGGTVSCYSSGYCKVRCDFGMGWRMTSGLSYCPHNNGTSNTILGVGSFSISVGYSSSRRSAYINVTDCSDREDWLYGIGSFDFSYSKYDYNKPVNIWYSSCCWVIYGSWTLRTQTNLTWHGTINSSPRTSADHLVRLRQHCPQSIEIPIYDPDGDRVRCRWATRYESNDVAYRFSSYANLSSEKCTVHYKGNASTGLYPVALSIEDYDWRGNVKSIVPLQFFVDVVAAASCRLKPILTGRTPKDGSCIDIPPSTTIKIILEATHESTNNRSISEFITSGAPQGMSKSSLQSYIGDGGRRTYIQALSWTPKYYQYSKQVMLCFKPLDDAGVEGEKRCITLRPGSSDTPRPVSGSFYYYVVDNAEAVFSVKFDHQCVFPSQRSGKVVFYLNSKAIYSIQPSTSYFCRIVSGSKLSCRIPRAVVGTSGNYEVVLEEGVVTGLGCDGGGPPSPHSVVSSGWWSGTCSSGYKLVNYGYLVCRDVDECEGRNDSHVSAAKVSTAIQPSPSLPARHSSSTSCYWSQFRCYSGQCISMWKRCDGYRHCYDGSDELNCVSASTTVGLSPSAIQPSPSQQARSSSSPGCSSYQWRCDSGKCIPMSWRCDNYRDCSDGSDEHCCSSYHWRCDSGKCIPMSWRCDNDRDCSDGSDEHCCSSYTFRCSSGQCIYKWLQCDGYRHCYDGSDELNCNVRSSAAHLSFSNHGTVFSTLPSQSASKSVKISPSRTKTAGIQMSSVAVPDYDLRLPADCDGRCINTRGSYVCECDEGFALSTDKTACVDVDECFYGNGGCSHLCCNTIGSYFCACPNEAFTMQSDKKTCTVNYLQVTCTAHYMYVQFDRALGFGLHDKHLHLNDPACKASGNSTHITVRTSHGDCGTTYTETSTHIIYQNTVRNSPSGGNGIITRDPEIKIDFHCKYFKYGQVSGKELEPLQRSVSVYASGYGDLDFLMDMYPTSKYEKAYTAMDYPLKKAVNDDLYIQLQVVSSDNHDLVIFPHTCKATTSTSPDTSPQYTFLENGCLMDSTMWYLYDIKAKQQIHIKMFTFVDMKFTHMYLHCKVIVCHRNTPDSRCKKGCLTSARKRRATDEGEHEEPSADLFAEVYLERDSASGDAAKNTDTGLIASTSSVGAVGALLLLAVGALLYHRQILLRRLRIMPETQVREGYRAEEDANESLEMEDGANKQQDVHDELLNNDWLGPDSNADLPPVTV